MISLIRDTGPSQDQVTRESRCPHRRRAECPPSPLLAEPEATEAGSSAKGDRRGVPQAGDAPSGSRGPLADGCPIDDRATRTVWTPGPSGEDDPGTLWSGERSAPLAAVGPSATRHDTLGHRPAPCLRWCDGPSDEKAWAHRTARRDPEVLGLTMYDRPQVHQSPPFDIRTCPVCGDPSQRGPGAVGCRYHCGRFHRHCPRSRGRP